jgi:hypothetical protein
VGHAGSINNRKYSVQADAAQLWVGVAACGEAQGVVTNAQPQGDGEEQARRGGRAAGGWAGPFLSTMVPFGTEKCAVLSRYWYYNSLYVFAVSQQCVCVLTDRGCVVLADADRQTTLFVFSCASTTVSDGVRRRPTWWGGKVRAQQAWLTRPGSLVACLPD